MTENVLDKIKAYKLEEVAADKAAKPLEAVEAEAREASPVRGFAESLMQASRDRLRPDCRDQESQPLQGFDPPRFRTGGTRQGL